MKGFSSKRIALKADVFQDRKYTVCRRVRPSFRPEILQAVAVRGLTASGPFIVRGRRPRLDVKCLIRDIKERVVFTGQH